MTDVWFRADQYSAHDHRISAGDSHLAVCGRPVPDGATRFSEPGQPCPRCKDRKLPDYTVGPQWAPARG